MLPNKACLAHKPYENWLEMKDEDFIFSLYPNDLIYVKHKKGIKLTRSNKSGSLPNFCEGNEFFLYYKSMDIASAALTCINHDNTYYIESLGIKTLEKLEKYVVDVLGTYHKVEREKRVGFN